MGVFRFWGVGVFWGGAWVPCFGVGGVCGVWVAVGVFCLVFWVFVCFFWALFSRVSFWVLVSGLRQMSKFRFFAANLQSGQALLSRLSHQCRGDVLHCLRWV